MSDADMGGFSQCNVDFVPASGSEPAHARFHGNISTDLPKDRPEIVRTGYAGWRTLDRKFTLFGKSLWDIDPYSYIALRVKSDGRKYFVNLQTDSIVPTDLHQHRLFTRKPGGWETVLISLNDFVRTNHGTVVEPQSEILRQKVKSVGISLVDRVPGPFDLCIERVWATNGLEEENAKDSDFALSGREGGRQADPKKPEKILI
ncbi:NADH:ubiquinone oxidoreductase complex I intermediate-associated protein 30 [Trichodelitschia bisporula]|uniref:NADH:ubiquinone oxidoreductase complex I intermediate-associated protein 30 n=1 Tax=Trichodelitschia bisporula TaxID=703511 RepID=A0A6G1HNS9_9PEZI|nr:NADH:ubiquinone oxidoreductase complex I intermediate-associated protein 30 [Trichodelitschia bisporula]